MVIQPFFKLYVSDTCALHKQAHAHTHTRPRNQIQNTCRTQNEMKCKGQFGTFVSVCAKIHSLNVIMKFVVVRLRWKWIDLTCTTCSYGLRIYFQINRLNYYVVVWIRIDAYLRLLTPFGEFNWRIIWIGFERSYPIFGMMLSSGTLAHPLNRWNCGHTHIHRSNIWQIPSLLTGFYRIYEIVVFSVAMEISQIKCTLICVYSCLCHHILCNRIDFPCLFFRLFGLSKKKNTMEKHQPCACIAHLLLSTLKKHNVFDFIGYFYNSPLHTVSLSMN